MANVFMSMAEATAKAMHETTIGQQMTLQPWLWPTCETLHFIGLAMLVGAAGLFDLRLLGFMRRASLSAVMELRLWAGLGLAINLVTGANNTTATIASNTATLNYFAQYVATGGAATVGTVNTDVVYSLQYN